MSQKKIFHVSKKISYVSKKDFLRLKKKICIRLSALESPSPHPSKQAYLISNISKKDFEMSVLCMIIMIIAGVKRKLEFWLQSVKTHSIRFEIPIIESSNVDSQVTLYDYLKYYEHLTK